MEDKTNYKKELGVYAVNTYIQSNMKIGLGSGSTAIWAVRHLAKLYKDKKITHIACVTTGPGTKLEALKLGLPIHDLNDMQMLQLDLTIDGADEYDNNSYLIKGGGGCLLQEKIVGYSSNQYIILVNEEKHRPNIGYTFPIPIEIIPSALRRVELKLLQTYKIKTMSMRLDARNIGPWITEEGNYLIDIVLDSLHIYNPSDLEREIKEIVGVVETGIFTRLRPIILSLSKDKSMKTIT